MLIDLSDTEKQECNNIAKERNDNKIKYHITTHKIAKRKTDEEIELEGVIGEYVVAKYLGISIDKALYRGGDDGKDLKYNDLLLQVKYNNRAGGTLYCAADKPFKEIVNILILVVPYDIDVYRIAGWIRRRDFMEKCHKDNWGYNDVLYVYQYQLRPANEL